MQTDIKTNGLGFATKRKQFETAMPLSCCLDWTSFDSAYKHNLQYSI